MARFLSAEWFEQLAEGPEETPVSYPEDPWVLEQVVTATPLGDVRYQLILAGGTARLHAEATLEPTITFTSDYRTAVAMARGELSTQAALLDGRVRVSGNLSGVDDALRQCSGLELVPAKVRAATTY